MRSIRIGVSACLLGENVRYDGGHKHNRYITGTLARFFTLVPVCPEVESGLSVPREAMHLEGDPDRPRLVTNHSRIDLTGQVEAFTGNRMKELEAENLSGFIFKKNSPSCGLLDVKIASDTVGTKGGSGIFAAALVRQFPQLPVEEEGRLNDRAIRENFIERVFAYRRLKDLLAEEPELGALIQFHTRHKLLLMAHSPSMYYEIGTLIGHGKEAARAELLQRYQALFMTALEVHSTVKKQTNVLQHIMGYFKNELTPAEKEELLAAIEQYHDNLVPLLVPATLLRHYVTKYRQSYLMEQWYLFPDPAEVMLLNHS